MPRLIEVQKQTNPCNKMMSDTRFKPGFKLYADCSNETSDNLRTLSKIKNNFFHRGELPTGLL